MRSVSRQAPAIGGKSCGSTCGGPPLPPAQVSRWVAFCSALTLRRRCLGSTCSSLTRARTAVSSIPLTDAPAAVRRPTAIAIASSSSSSSGGIAVPARSWYPPAGPVIDSTGYPRSRSRSMSRRIVRPETSSRSANSVPGQSRRACRSDSSVSRRLEVVSLIARKRFHRLRTDPVLNLQEDLRGPADESRHCHRSTSSDVYFSGKEGTMKRLQEVSDGPAISVHGLVKSYGDVRALDGVDLEAATGTVLGLLGPNGAGKTTTVRVLTTLLKPDEGTARVAGLDVVKDAHALRERIGLAGQYAAVDDNLTGIENLAMVGRLYGMKRKVARTRAHDLLERFDLVDAGDRIAKTYSGGMRRRLDLAAAIVTQPPVLFLDEPTTGLDPRSRIDLWQTIEDLVADGTTVLLTTQYLDEADRLADRIAVVDGGKVIAEGTSDDLKDRVGGERVEVTLADEADAPIAASALLGMCQDSPQIDGNVVRVTVERRDGAVMQAARLLDRTDAGVEDIAVRRPTLDDVFLTLTGHTAEEAAEPADPEEADDKVEVAA